MIHHPPQRLAILVCLCGFLLSGETLPAAQAGTEKAGVWLDVPFIQQEKDGCGAAVMAMVMQYWERQRVSSPEAPVRSIASSAAHIQHELYSRQAHGIYASAMEGYLKKHGYQTFTFIGTHDDLKQHLAKGRPLIVALKPAPGEKALHYAVVVGVDWERRLVLLNDPAEKKLLNVDVAEFDKQWKAVRNWTLLALPE